MLKTHYQIIKSIMLDVDDYIHDGLSLEAIEKILDETTLSIEGCIWRPIEYLPIYEIGTAFIRDEDVHSLADTILLKLDMEVINTKMKKNVKLN